MLKGTYVFKQDGVEIGRSENLITTNGKNTIIKYLTNSTSEWASAITVGALPTAATVNDMTLKYEIARTSVTLKSYISGTPNLIVVKGTLDSSVVANIYEVGVFPLSTGQVFGTRDQFSVEDFSNVGNWITTSGTAYTTNAYAAQSPISPRAGSYSVNLAASSTIKNSLEAISLAKYGVIDTLDILVNVPSGSTGALALVFTDINGNSYSFAPTGYNFSNSTGSSVYQVLSANLTPGLLVLSSITSLSISTTSAITLDAIRISIGSELSANTGLVSRSVLTTPIAKVYGIPLDIEYFVQLS